jgi:hypothetical protein
MSKMTPDCTQCADRPAVAGLGGWCQACEDAYASQAEPSREEMESPALTPEQLHARYPWVSPDYTRPLPF